MEPVSTFIEDWDVPITRRKARERGMRPVVGWNMWWDGTRGYQMTKVCCVIDNMQWSMHRFADRFWWLPLAVASLSFVMAMGNLVFVIATKL